MRKLRGVLLDLGGVVYIGDTPLPGVIGAIGRLRKAGLAVRYITNTTRTSRREIGAKLRHMGVPLEPGELFTPARAARDLIESQGFTPHLLVHSALKEDFAGMKPGASEAVVVGDCGDEFTYAALNEAFRALNRGAAFFALANDRSFRDIDGHLSLDAGPFVKALAHASRRDPVVLGKPAPAFFRAAVASLGCGPEEAAMIGDGVETDIAGAMAIGLLGVLVCSGKYETGDERLINPPPSAVAKDLVAAVEWLLSP
jgi:HAD superfamily hydrolase (TIGR01458 family)